MPIFLPAPVEDCILIPVEGSETSDEGMVVAPACVVRAPRMLR